MPGCNDEPSSQHQHFLRGARFMEAIPLPSPVEWHLKRATPCLGTITSSPDPTACTWSLSEGINCTKRVRVVTTVNNPPCCRMLRVASSGGVPFPTRHVDITLRGTCAANWCGIRAKDDRDHPTGWHLKVHGGQLQASSKHDMTTSRKVAAAATRGRPSARRTTCGWALYAVSSALMFTTSRQRQCRV